MAPADILNYTMKEARLFNAIQVVLLMSFLFFSGCSRSEPEFLHGYIEGEFVYIASPLGGILEELAVQRGQLVQKGDKLFSLESEAEKDMLRKAEAAVVFSENELQRNKNLRNKPGLISERDYQQSLSLYNQDKEQLARARWDLEKKTQFAPEAGIIQDTLFRKGEVISAGRPAVVLLPPKNVKLRFFVPERKLSSIKQGQILSVRVDGISELLSATVNYVSPRTEYTPPVIFSEDSREKLVTMIEAVFDEKTAAMLHPGQPVDVKLGQ